MIDPSGIIPDELMSADKKVAMLNHLMAAPFESKVKVRAAKGWSAITGVRLSTGDLDLIDATGLDHRTERGT